MSKLGLGKPSRARPRRVVGVVLVAVAVLLVSPAPSGAETALRGFVASASADGGRITFSVPAFVVVEDVLDGGGAVARSVVDPFGASSFASLPYPGDLAIAGPGLFQAVTGQEFPGAYPFYVNASHPTNPKQELMDQSGTYHLNATAGEGQATGASQFYGQGGEGQSGGGGGTRVFTSSVVKGDQVAAVAETLNEALNLGGGALRIASVRSRSETTYQAGDATPTTKTDLLIEGGSAGDMGFGFGPQGFTVAKQGVPIPAGSGLEQLNQALEPAGISLRIAGAEPLSGGAAAHAFEVAFRQKPAGGEIPGVIIRLRFGGAATSVVFGEETETADSESVQTTQAPAPARAESTEPADRASEPLSAHDVAPSRVLPGGVPTAALVSPASVSPTAPPALARAGMLWRQEAEPQA